MILERLEDRCTPSAGSLQLGLPPAVVWTNAGKPQVTTLTDSKSILGELHGKADSGAVTGNGKISPISQTDDQCGIWGVDYVNEGESGPAGSGFGGLLVRFYDEFPSDFTVAIDWGDGTGEDSGWVDNALPFEYDAIGVHTYTDPGRYGATVTITDSCGRSIGGEVVFDVWPSAVTIVSLTPPSATEGVNTGVTTVASFTDENPNGFYGSAQIEWGDGTSSPGTFVDNRDGTLGVQGAHTYATAATGLTFRVTVFDWNTDISASAETLIDVAPANHPPVLDPIPDMGLALGKSLTLAVHAFDPDSPPQTLTYSLAPGAPASAHIDPVTGVFSVSNLKFGVYTITVQVADNANPPLSATQTFHVFVAPQVKVLTRNDGSVKDPTAVTFLTATFNTRVNIDSGVFELTRLGSGGGPVDVAIASINVINGKTVVTLQFSGPFVLPSGALVSGQYALTTHGSLIHDAVTSLALDGDNDGLPGGDNLFRFSVP
jgi:hypothetical protein